MKNYEVGYQSTSDRLGPVYDTTPWGKPSWQVIKCLSIGLILYVISIFSLYENAGYLTGLYCSAATAIFFFGFVKWRIDAIGLFGTVMGVLCFLYLFWVSLPLMVIDLKEILFELTNH